LSYLKRDETRCCSPTRKSVHIAVPRARSDENSASLRLRTPRDPRQGRHNNRECWRAGDDAETPRCVAPEQLQKVFAGCWRTFPQTRGRGPTGSVSGTRCTSARNSGDTAIVRSPPRPKKRTHPRFQTAGRQLRYHLHGGARTYDRILEEHASIESGGIVTRSAS